MCGRLTQAVTWQEMRDHYALIPTQPALNLSARYNIGPRQRAVIVRPLEGGLAATPATFDLVPSWWKRPHKDKTYSSFNAKSETVAELKTFKDAWAKGQRAIVPVDGFYEWSQPKQKGAAPFYITRADNARMQLAAIWSRWINPETEQEDETFAILTTTPNADMATVPHHRCPVVIGEDETDAWLNGSTKDVQAMLHPPANGTFSFVRVTSYVNKVGHEGPACHETQSSLF